MIKLYFVLLSLVILFESCGESESKKVAIFEEFEDTLGLEDGYDNESYGSKVVAIPFTVKDGVKIVDVKINDAIGVNMIVDTGCSGAMISLSEARYLVEKGALTPEDVVGEGQSMVADGRVIANMVVRLDKITIGNKLTASNVLASVSENLNSPLLIGNEVLDRVKTIAIDNENNNILFFLR